MAKRFDTHLCEVDDFKIDGLTRIRFSNKDAVEMSGDTGMTMKLTDKERLDLIHMLSK